MNTAQLKAPPLRVPYWIDASGSPLDSLSLADLGTGYKVIFCFKASCPGCHSRGFPAMKKLVDNLSDKNFGFAVIHTAFDDDPFNSQDKVREMQLKYDLQIPFGHDPKVDEAYPTFMQDYRTRGTPFFVVIDPNGDIAFGDFGLDADKLISHFS
jgi:hypothetical protein